MAATALTKAIVFNRAGHFMLQKYKSDGTLDPDAIYSSLGGIVKSIQRAGNPSTSDLEDGNSDYPAHTYVTGNENTLTIGLSTYDPKLEAFVKDCVVTDGAEATKVEMRTSQEITIAASVTLKSDVKDENAFIFVQDKNGKKFKKAATETPAAGEYNLAVTDGKATLTFAEIDAGVPAFVTYDSYVDNVTTVAEREKSKLTAFRVWIFADCMAYDETQEVQSEIIIDKATVNGGVTAPALSKDPTGGWELGIKTSAPRPGYSPVQTKYRPKSA